VSPRRRRAPLLAAPALAVVALVLLPLAYIVLRAAGSGRSWSVLARRQTLDLVLDTSALVGAVTACALLVGVPLAWLVTRTDLPGARVWTILAALPLVIPSYVAALALLGAFGPRGLLQRLLEGAFGTQSLPEIYGFPGAVLALTLSTYPYVFLLAAAALREADPALEEASRGLGRPAFATFLRTTVPSLRPSLAAGGLLVALYTLSDFGAVSLMRYDALTRAIYLRYRALIDRAPAAALALLLVALTLLILVLEARSRGRGRFSRGSPGAARRRTPVALGRWRLPALAYCGLVVSAFLLVPLAVLGYWFANGVSLGRPLGLPWHLAGSSLLVSLAAAAVATAAALPVALLARGHPAPWTRGLERLGYTPNALPGIVIALSLVFFAANYATPLYGTMALLIFAYTVRFFPQALAGASSGLEGVDPRLEEAARGLGRRPARVFGSVTVPLARPGLLAGAALVFLSTMKELPATLLLRPLGFDTLATEIWRFSSLGLYSRAAPPALLLVAVSAPFVYLLVVRPRSAGGTGG